MLVVTVTIFATLAVPALQVPRLAQAQTQLPPLHSRIIVTETVTLAPLRDNTIYSDIPFNAPLNAKSNGAGEYLFVGADAEGDVRRALLDFNISGNIPSGSTIYSATLQLTMNGHTVGSGDQPVSLHRLTSDWGEGTAKPSFDEEEGTISTPNSSTWLHTFFSDSTWTTAGGDFVSSASDSVTTIATANSSDVATYVWDSAQVVADVQTWLDNPAASHGWLLQISSAPNNSMRRFSSRENSTTSSQPQLTIVYALPEVPDLAIVKRADVITVTPGSAFTYTIVISNSGLGDAINGVVTDELTTGLSLAGPITLEPSTAGTVGTLPTAVSNLTVAIGERVTVTIPVLVANADIITGDVFINTAFVTADDVSTPPSDSAVVSAFEPASVVLYVYLPGVMK